MPLNLAQQPAYSDGSGFDRHGIQHTSATQINMWADAPCAWVAKYLFNHKGVFGAAPKAGMLVEDAIVNVLARGFTADDAISSAEKEYNKFIALSGTDTDRKRGEGLRGMIEGALEVLSPYGEPEFDEQGKQKKVEILCRGNGWSIPVIGYIDLHYPKHGKIIDIKTTSRMPSELSRSHARQQAIYYKAFGNQSVDFLYVTPKKASVLTNNDPASSLAEIKTLLNRQEAFLRLGDRDLLRSVVPVMIDSFYWTGDREALRQIYGV